MCLFLLYTFDCGHGCYNTLETILKQAFDSFMRFNRIVWCYYSRSQSNQTTSLRCTQTYISPNGKNLISRSVRRRGGKTISSLKTTISFFIEARTFVDKKHTKKGWKSFENDSIVAPKRVDCAFVPTFVSDAPAVLTS